MTLPSIAAGFTALAFFSMPLNAHAIDLDTLAKIVPDDVMIVLIEDCGDAPENATIDEQEQHNLCVQEVLTEFLGGSFKLK